MCGVVKYRVEKDGESHPFLVAEESHEYRLSIVNSPENAVDLVNSIFRLKNQAEEYVYMLASDSKGSVIGVFEVSHGTVNRSLCSSREIYLRALISGASSIIVIHNHPSGDASPSDVDIAIYNRLLEAGTIMGVDLSDFIIVGDDYYSFREKEEWNFRGV